MTRSAFTLSLALVASAPALAAPSVDLASSAEATELVLDGEGFAATRIVKLADVTLATEGANGLTVYITSGSLTKADGRTPIAFQVVLVTDNAAAPAASAFTTAAGATYAWSSVAPGTVERDLYIKYTPRSLQDPGAYAANVDVSVVDN